MTASCQMNSIFAFMAKEELDKTQTETRWLRDNQMLLQAKQYAELEEQAGNQAKDWLINVELDHLSGSKESAYLKKLGHRPLTKGDLISLILLYGDDQQKQIVHAFKQVQLDLSTRLGEISNLGLVLKQAGINYNTYYTRSKEAERWKAGEVINILMVLERLKL